MLKILGFAVLGIIVLVIGLGALFLNFYPSFGGSPTESQKAEYANFTYYKDGKFKNQQYTDMSMSFSKILTLISEYRRTDVQRQPDKEIPVYKVDSLNIVNYADSVPRVTWFGHSAFLLEFGDKKILLDPMLGESPSPHPWIGTKRYSDELPIVVEKLPEIDAVLFSHDHYDHLDYESVMMLKDKVKDFYVPLGVGAHLKAWGVSEDKIHEMAWWDEAKQGDVLFACTPAQHFSGRGIFNRETTLWASWVVKTEDLSVYFSGDSGYSPHFKEIGNRYGSFDFAMIECGQYNKLWSDIHMMPEESAQACVDLNAKVSMPIHWGAFTLALHSWTEPVVRFSTKAEELNLPYITPEIGIQVLLDNTELYHKKWWEL
ncbi:MBL fold metallo-hydrolase [Chondrinema litorale]|uniref:MBL fold metallo-hydrolase n=1 Tax=Chondrinema litorale TaxID=2994555 RepID=UPI002543B33A|nr:MBL fold metallo-hydrolase [Chondrinema litorale]UZR95707.1 MBL fold metallo-hydrolase [Chondrinema litorale]